LECKEFEIKLLKVKVSIVLNDFVKGFVPVISSNASRTVAPIDIFSTDYACIFWQVQAAGLHASVKIACSYKV
jgi:hypothetical protein